MEETTNPLAEAQKVIEQDKKARYEAFNKEMDELSKKYNCIVGVVYVQKDPNLPSVAQLTITPL